MALTYTDHVDRAFRGAAVALTLPSPSGPDLVAVRQLHDDVTQALAEATRIILLSSLGEPRVERERAGIPAAKAMLTALSDYPRLAVPAADEHHQRSGGLAGPLISAGT